jgi:hypothetical protein
MYSKTIYNLCALCGKPLNYIYNAISTINPMIAKII